MVTNIEQASITVGVSHNGQVRQFSVWRGTTGGELRQAAITDYTIRGGPELALFDDDGREVELTWAMGRYAGQTLTLRPRVVH